MTDPQAIAESYIALWNETDEGARQRLLAAHWTADASYVDPMAAVQGSAEIAALIGEVQKRFPGFRFNLIGKPDGHGDKLRFRWSLGPGDYVDAPIEGTDFAVLADGRLHTVTGFLDKLPPG